MVSLSISNAVFMEAILVGLITSVLSILIPAGFLFGFLVHIICEIAGINKIYCDKGHACKKPEKKVSFAEETLPLPAPTPSIGGGADEGFL